MKIRNGFVSNSSSSSFIISGKIDKVAKSMLKTVIDDFGSNWGSKKANKKEMAEYKNWKRYLEKALKNKDVQSGKIGITMPSCNYETYILQVGDKVHVQTARNHNWEMDYDVYGNGSDDGESDIVYNTINSANFFNVRNTLIHGEEIDSCKNIPCPNCTKKGRYSSGTYVVCIDGKKRCSRCYDEIK